MWTGCVWRTLSPDSGVLTQCTCHISNENHRQPQAGSASNGGSFWARSKRVRWGGHCSLLSNVPAPAVTSTAWSQSLHQVVLAEKGPLIQVN